MHGVNLRLLECLGARIVEKGAAKDAIRVHDVARVADVGGAHGCDERDGIDHGERHTPTRNRNETCEGRRQWWEGTVQGGRLGLWCESMWWRDIVP